MEKSSCSAAVSLLQPVPRASGSMVAAAGHLVNDGRRAGGQYGIHGTAADGSLPAVAVIACSGRWLRHLSGRNPVNVGQAWALYMALFLRNHGAMENARKAGMKISWRNVESNAGVMSRMWRHENKMASISGVSATLENERHINENGVA